MAQFYNPYQFIEFTGTVNDEEVNAIPFADIKAGKTHVRHDYWLSSPGYHSGRILCQIELKSPVLTGNVHTKPKPNKNAATVVEQYQYKDNYAIQANSLRGMVACLLETLSQSALRVLSDKKFKFSDSTHDFFMPNGKACKKIYTNALPWGNGRTALTPTETLLGAVQVVKETDKQTDSAANLASRVRFSDALGKDIAVIEQLFLLKILDSPKPSVKKATPVACMYFKPRAGSGYIAKTALKAEKDEANGRKFYLPHITKDHWKTKLPKIDARGEPRPDKQCIQCKPLKPDQTLYFHIDFDNLSTDELHLLQTSLKPSADFQHSIGLGKALGLGQIILTPLASFFINRVQRYSLKALTTQQRYSAVQKHHPTFPVGIEERYPNEAIAFDKAIECSVDQTSTLIDETTLKLLQLMGNPKNQQEGIPVCYPYDEDNRQGPYNEDEGFKWFVSNKGQYLPTLNTTKDIIPTLNSSHKTQAPSYKTKPFNKSAQNNVPPAQATLPCSDRLVLVNLPVCQNDQEKAALEKELRAHFAEFGITGLHLADNDKAYISFAKNNAEEAFQASRKYPLVIKNQRITILKEK